MVTQPERQPILPPPEDQQKAKGFVRFLKKHSSPTHNRVTAGGRIVPMEPRSPPPFSLSTNSARNVPSPARNQYQNMKAQQPPAWHEDGRPPRPVQGYEDYQPVFLKNAIPAHVGMPINIKEFTASPPEASSFDDWSRNEYGYQNQMAQNSRGNFEMPAPDTYASQQQMQYTSFPVNDSYYAPPAQLGTGIPLTQQYIPDVGAWPIPDPAYPHRTPLSACPSPQEMLAAWEQHYRDLTEQLNNIDRHRAMNNLDQTLAEQRRVIVQQRSDAKDTIREYQATLGQRRMPESSTESWATSFNVEAPAYIPPHAQKYNSFEKAPDFTPGAAPFQRPQGSSQRKIIPIVAPPPPSEPQSPSKRAQDVTGHRMQNESHVANDINTRRSHENVQAHTPRHVSHHSWDNNPAQQPVADSVNHANSMTFVMPPHDQPPSNIVEQTDDIVRAVSRPVGTLSHVRMMDGGIIKITGTGKQFSEPTSPVEDPWSSTESDQRPIGSAAPPYEFDPFKIDNSSSQSSLDK